MKKLMTMLAAVATAFGLYAADANAKYEVGFEAGEDQFEGGVLKIGGETGWSCTDGSKLTEGTYDDDAYDLTRNPAFAESQNLKFLNVKTALTDGLKRDVDHTVGTDAFYFDQLVKFTAADEPMAVTGAKIALYVQDLSEADTPKAETNLYVVAGQYVDNVLGAEPVVYNLGAIDINEWHRLTIKTFKAYNNDSVLAFEIFVDGNAMSIQDADLVAYDAASAQGLNVTAQALNFAKKLFPSIDETSTTIDTIELAGQGGLDDFIATTTLPGEFAQDLNVTLSWDDHVTALTYTAHGQQFTADIQSGVAVIPWALNMSIVVNPTFEENWAFDKFTGEGAFAADGYMLTNLAADDQPRITSKDTTPRVSVEIGGETATFPTLAAAFAALPASGTASITLAQDLTGDCGIGDNGEGYTEAGITTAVEVTLDLAGHTIGLKTDASITEGALIETASATLTITDTQGGGKIDATGVDAGAVGIYTGAKLIVEGEEEFFIDGDVIYDNGMTEDDIAISAGSFKSDDDQAFYLKDFLADGYKADYAEPYWTVIEKPYATIALTATHATVSGITPDQKIYEGDELEFTAEADENYDAPVVTIGGVQQTAADQYTYTVTAADIEAKTLAISVDASATAWTISYYDVNDESDPPVAVKTETYTVETKESQALWSGDRTAEGLTFKGWQDDQLAPIEDPDTYLQDKTGPLAIYGEWEAIPTDVTITLPSPLPTGVESLVVSQKVDDVWTEVKDGKIGIGNDYVVIANPSAGYRVENPIVEGTAEADIEVTENDFDGKIAQINYVAQINDDPTKKYESLKAAVEAAEGGDTINILANCDVPETICFYNTGTNAENQITLKNDHHVELTTAGKYSFYIVNANVKVTGTGMFSKTNGVASAFVVGSCKDPGSSGRPAKLGYGILDFECDLTGGIEALTTTTDYKDAPSGMIKVEAGFCNFVGGSVINWRSNISKGAYQGKCVSASYTKYTDIDNDITNDYEYVGVVTIQAGTFRANTPLECDEGATLKIIGKDNTAKVRPLDDSRELDYSAFCEPGYTFLKVTDDQDPDYQWYKIGMNTFSITVTDGDAQGTADPAEFTVETEFSLTVTLTKPTAPEGKEFDSWSANVGTIDDAKSTLTIDAFPNKDVVVTVVWKDAASEPVIPGEDIDIPAGKDINDINTNDAVKAELLKAPGDIETTKAYRDLFNAVPGSADGKVAFVLNSDGTNAVVAAETAADTTVLDAALDADAVTATVENPLVGFYYSLKQNEDVTKLGFKADTDKNKLGGKDTIQFTLEKGETSEFYQMIVTPAPVK